MREYRGRVDDSECDQKRTMTGVCPFGRFAKLLTGSESVESVVDYDK